MIADLLFSVGITVAAVFALAVGIDLFHGVRYIPRRRVGIIGKLLSASGSLTDRSGGKSGDDGPSLETGGAGEDRGPRLRSFGDVVHAFAEAKLRKRAP